MVINFNDKNVDKREQHVLRRMKKGMRQNGTPSPKHSKMYLDVLLHFNVLKRQNKYDVRVFHLFTVILVIR